MSQKTQYQKKLKQRQKRRKNRKQLAAKGKDLSQYYYGKFFLKTEEKAS